MHLSLNILHCHFRCSTHNYDYFDIHCIVMRCQVNPFQTDHVLGGHCATWFCLAHGLKHIECYNHHRPFQRLSNREHSPNEQLGRGDLVTLTSCVTCVGRRPARWADCRVRGSRSWCWWCWRTRWGRLRRRCGGPTPPWCWRWGPGLEALQHNMTRSAQRVTTTHTVRVRGNQQ